MLKKNKGTNPPPKELGYRFPAEWEPHRATWLSYPHADSYSWPGTLPSIFPFYHQFIREITKGERVCVNIHSKELLDMVRAGLSRSGQDVSKIDFFIHPTNDAWCRDHGPAFVVNPYAKSPRMVVCWEYDAWGGKYPYELDKQIPALVAQCLDIPMVCPGIVMEGGAVESNGKGTLLTTASCLLNKTRNPHLSQQQVEKYLQDYYGVEQVLWLGNGIDGDDTHGHIEHITRFFREDAVVAVVEHDKTDPNHKPLKDNLKLLRAMREAHGKQLDIAELPMPPPVVHQGQRLPASYANFYITNHSVIVPLYRCKEDDKAMTVIEECFPGRQVIGIDSVEIICGLGSFHRLSQQEPEVKSEK
ncbi:MAG: agmatine deiminase family protein [Bacteroidetes bacterium]|nr:agmatine deiminase family protein [Bacteroidota bacterium]